MKPEKEIELLNIATVVIVIITIGLKITFL